MPGASGSAVIDSLSLNGAAPSRMTVAGGLHVLPPSIDRLASTALDEPLANVSPVNAIPIWYAMPSGPIATHGSLARAKSPPFAALPPVQRESAACDHVQVAPASNEYAARSPRAPPSVQRSCCQTPIRCDGFCGSIATYGSTSAPVKATPLTGALSQSAEKGDAPVIRIRSASGCAPSGGNGVPAALPVSGVNAGNGGGGGPCGGGVAARSAGTPGGTVAQAGAVAPPSATTIATMQSNRTAAVYARMRPADDRGRAVLPRLTSSNGNCCCNSAGWPSSLANSCNAAAWPISTIGVRMLVSPGVCVAPRSVLSTPVIETSSGMATPASRHATIAPTANTSFVAMTAVGRGRFASSSRIAATPES